LFRAVWESRAEQKARPAERVSSKPIATDLDGIMTVIEPSDSDAHDFNNTIEIRPNHPEPRTVVEFGAVCFLASRSKTLHRFPVGAISQWWEIPIALGQFWEFRHDDVPRAAISWAALSPEAERRYVVEGFVAQIL
jgi:hypothetical protein